MDTCDIVIVGAGAGGSAAAFELSKSNLKIVCLEQGTHTSKAELPGNGIDWEIRSQKNFNINPNLRQAAADYPINNENSPISIANFNGVGGSTVLYSAHYPRFHPADFFTERLDGVGADWPISYEDLEPYYEEDRRHTPVAGMPGDTAYPPIENLLPPVPLGPLGQKIANGFNSLGWHWWPSYAGIATLDFQGHRMCVNLGPCNTGCPIGSKSSDDLYYWPKALKNGVYLKTNSRVSEIEIDQTGKVSGVLYFDLAGNKHFLKAKIVVMAASGIGTPRLLLNSKSAHFPEGIGNSSGLVGRNLMLHPWGYVEGLFREDLKSHFGPQGCLIASHEFHDTQQNHPFKRGFTMQFQRGPFPTESATRQFSRKQLPFGEQHHEIFRRTFDHTAHLSIIVEDLPELHNRVILDPKLKDSHGIAAPKIEYKLSENSKKALSFGILKGKELMMSSGALTSFGFGPVRETGYHIMGTTKMGVDPKNSVVNAWGQSHDVSNLFVVDSSVFVTSSSVNPTATIHALALRTANYIRNNFTSIVNV
jgi:choline dehydrogenase-like flavoprotein